MVEGFLLLQCPELVDMADILVILAVLGHHPFVGVFETLKCCSSMHSQSPILCLLSPQVCLTIPKEALWQRRKQRAESMRGLPEGMGENANYEVGWGEEGEILCADPMYA